MQYLSDEPYPKKLLIALDELSTLLKEVRLTILDRPKEHALADQFENSITDVESELENAINMARSLQDIESIQIFRKFLGECQRRIDDMDYLIQTNLCSFKRLEELANLRQDRKGEWIGWVESLTQSTAHIAPRLFQIRQTLLINWVNLNSAQFEVWKALKAQENALTNEIKE